jgi:imidazolonepropionase-like amidohydrolase
LFNADAFWINYNRISIESIARYDVKIIRSKKLYDDIGEKNDYYVDFEDNRITYINSEKPLQNDVEIIVEDATVTPAFIDLHSHIGMVRTGEHADEDESNDHMHAVSPLINALHSIYMDDVSFTESVENGVLYSVVFPGSGNFVVGKAVFYINLRKMLKKRL